MSAKQDLFTMLINLYSNRYLKYKIYHDLEQLFTVAQKEKASHSENSIPKNKGTSPVILLGMHRSGTTLMSRFLRQSGVYMGRLRGKDTDESLFFQNVNKAVFKLSGASWDEPERFQSALESESHHQALVNILGQYCLLARKTRTYLRGSDLGDSTLFTMPCAWGWKDPRTCFSLPLWLKLFPEAKVIYIHRNGVDVAQSLVVRNERLGGKHPFSERTRDLSGAFRLWEIYNQQCLMNIRPVHKQRLLTLSYENLLENPQVNLNKVFGFLEHSPVVPVSDITSGVIAKRAYAFNKNPDLIEYYKTVKESELMQTFGYNDIQC